MKKIILTASVALIFVSTNLLFAEEMGPSPKETLITQESSDIKRALYETRRDLQILSQRLDRLDDKVNRIDRDVKDLRMR